MSDPADVPEEVAQRMKDLALQAHRILGCNGGVALGFPLGRRTWPGGHLSARGQHPARHDAAQPRARTGACDRHRLCRAGRTHRGGRPVSSTRIKRANGPAAPPGPGAAQAQAGPDLAPRRDHQRAAGAARDASADRQLDDRPQPVRGRRTCRPCDGGDGKGAGGMGAGGRPRGVPGAQGRGRRRRPHRPAESL